VVGRRRGDMRVRLRFFARSWAVTIA